MADFKDKKGQDGKLRTEKVRMAYQEDKLDQNGMLSLCHRCYQVKQEMIGRKVRKGRVFRKKSERFHFVTVAVNTQVCEVCRPYT